MLLGEVLVKREEKAKPYWCKCAATATVTDIGMVMVKEEKIIFTQNSNTGLYTCTQWYTDLHAMVHKPLHTLTY